MRGTKRFVIAWILLLGVCAAIAHAPGPVFWVNGFLVGLTLATPEGFFHVVE